MLTIYKDKRHSCEEQTSIEHIYKVTIYLLWPF